ncbi:MAG TPA: ATP-dependent zinc metalloprotease FtsH [Vicinamibacterales bacterium]|nr:ATP-dependent zinc metalloprotease FtsH [Vicinamibacterales bacterium]
MKRFFHSRRHVSAIAALAILILSGAGVYAAFRSGPPQVPFSALLGAFDRGEVSAIRAREDDIRAELKTGAVLRTTVPAGYLARNPELLASLARGGVRIEVDGSGKRLFHVLATLLGAGVLGLVGFTAWRTTTGRIPSVTGRSKIAGKGENPVTFDDVAGVDEAKEELREIVDFLREPERFAGLGGRIPRGVLLAGPPGTGKTLLARSIAGEAGVPFLFASGSEFVEMFAGVGAARIRRLFKDARKHGKCIIFIDEIDAVGRSRGSHSLSHEEREQTLNQLLVEMDGFEGHGGIIVIAATNRQDILDPALMRPGRFDRQVSVGNPDLRGREDILRVHARGVKMAEGVELLRVARGTPGFSGADLANLINEAALLAGRTGRVSIAQSDLEAARDKVMMGVERKSLQLTARERVITAWHEAGHAVVAALLPHADPVHKVSIVPRGRAMGVTMQLPDTDRHTYTRDYLETQVAILMGGRAAEQLFLQVETSGASNDIERATDIATHMVCKFGMSPLGPLAFRRQDDEGAAKAGFSDDTARQVDEEIRAIVTRGLETAQRLLEARRDRVQAMAERLLDVETIDAEDIRALVTSA